jgi:hypothetical protein
MAIPIKRAIGIAILPVGLLSTAPAHADDQRFIDELRAHGVPVLIFDKAWISGGTECATNCASVFRAPTLPLRSPKPIR